MTSPYSKQQPSGQPPYGPPGQPPYGPPGQPPYGYGPYYPAPGYGLPTVNKHTGWFVVNWLFFWPLALYSLLSAYMNIDRALYAGDVAGAEYQANRVRRFGIIALCLGIAWIVLVILMMVVATSAVHSCIGPYGTSC